MLIVKIQVNIVLVWIDDTVYFYVKLTIILDDTDHEDSPDGELMTRSPLVRISMLRRQPLTITHSSLHTGIQKLCRSSTIHQTSQSHLKDTSTSAQFLMPTIVQVRPRHTITFKDTMTTTKKTQATSNLMSSNKSEQTSIENSILDAYSEIDEHNMILQLERMLEEVNLTFYILIFYDLYLYRKINLDIMILVMHYSQMSNTSYL
jgi:hypothetical protein